MKKGLLLFALIFSFTIPLSASKQEENEREWSKTDIWVCAAAGTTCLGASVLCWKKAEQMLRTATYLAEASSEPSYFNLIGFGASTALAITSISLDFAGKGLLELAGYKTIRKIQKNS